MTLFFFLILVSLGIFTALYLKTRWSGSDLNHTKLYLSLIFNGCFVVPYIDLIKNNDFLFLGNRPDITADHPLIGWIAFTCIFIHLYALPVKRKIKW